MDKKSNDSNREKILRIIKYLIIGFLTAAGLYLFFNYLFLLLLPFIFAYFIAFLLRPVSSFLNQKFKIPVKTASLIIIFLFYALLGFLIVLLINRIVSELYSLSRNYTLDSKAISGFISGMMEKVESFIQSVPFLSDNNFIDDFRAQFNNMLNTLVAEFGTFIVTKVPAIVTAIVVKFPGFLISAILMIVSTFYIALDYDRINIFLMIQIPKKVRITIIDIKNKFLEAIYKYLRAYAILIFITFAELTVGFLIIGIDYAFLLAMIISFIDILPILGTGTVLIPWGIYLIIQKCYFEGFALLILYATITVIRQVIEPKIIGKSIGLYPVVTLIAIYIGFNILGFFGLFLLPITILIIKNLNDEGKIKLWKPPQPQTEPPRGETGDKKS